MRQVSAPTLILAGRISGFYAASEPNNYIRASPHPNVHKTGLAALTTEATIEVNFLWIIFPSALYVMITGFFIATMLQTRDLRSWENLALALLWCKEAGDNQLTTLKQFEARGKQVEVQLVYDGTSSWRERVMSGDMNDNSAPRLDSLFLSSLRDRDFPPFVYNREVPHSTCLKPCESLSHHQTVFPST